MRILLIDDEPDFTLLLVEYLQDKYNVEQVHSGKVALEKIKLITYNLIVTDLNMPDIDGLKIISHIKKSEANFRTPIIVISGFIDKNIHRIAQLNIIDTLPKSTLMEDIVTAIEKKILPNVIIENQNQAILDYLHDSIVETLTHFLGEKINIGAFTKQQPEDVKPYITTTITMLSEKVNGTLIFCFDRKFIEYLIKEVFQDQTDSIPEEQHVELVGELANQTAGFFKIHLDKFSLTINIGVPTSFIGELKIPPQQRSIYTSIKIDDSHSFTRVDLENITGKLVSNTEKKNQRRNILF